MGASYLELTRRAAVIALVYVALTADDFNGAVYRVTYDNASVGR